MFDIEKTGRVIDDCAGRCREAEFPLAALADFCGKLESRDGWTEREVDLVGRTVGTFLEYQHQLTSL